MCGFFPSRPKMCFQMHVEFCEISMQNMAPDRKRKRRIQTHDAFPFRSKRRHSAKYLHQRAFYGLPGCRKKQSDRFFQHRETCRGIYSKQFCPGLIFRGRGKIFKLKSVLLFTLLQACTPVFFNFRDYLIQLRVKKAQELLITGKYKIYEISIMTGYKNSKYFAAQFKAVTGLTPSEFANSEAAKSTGA